MAALDQVVVGYQGDNTPSVGGGATFYPTRHTCKRAADGTALSAAPPIDGTTGLIRSVTRDSAGRYTVVLGDLGQTAAQVAPRVSANTSELYGSVVVTDATHLAVATDTNAGVATDSIFTLAVDLLSL